MERREAGVQVRVIEAREVQCAAEEGRPGRQGRCGKLRVAAYCRVSTEMESQEGSYETQISHYRQMIEEREEWEPAGVYADHGISATSTRGREEFLRMIADCEAGRIGMIVTKSISRFARNTLDCLKYVRRLRELGGGGAV